MFRPLFFCPQQPEAVIIERVEYVPTDYCGYVQRGKPSVNANESEVTDLHYDWPQYEVAGKLPPSKSANALLEVSILSEEVVLERRINQHARLARLVEGASAISLPQHLWDFIAQYNGIAVSGALLQCCEWLQHAFTVDKLWQQHACSSGSVRSVPQVDRSLADILMSRLDPSDWTIDWKRLLQLNARLRRGRSVWVRIQDLDLRLPLSQPEANTTSSATHTARVDSREAFISELQRVLRLKQPRLMRIRHLQACGRPGVVVDSGSLQVGGHFLLELALHGGRGWALPPTSSTLPPALTSAPSAAPSILPAWQLLHLPGSTAEIMSTLQVRRLLDPTEASVPEHMALLHIVSDLFPQEVWLSVNLEEPLGSMYQAIMRALRRESPLLAEMHAPIQVHLMDPCDPTRWAAVPNAKPLRELFWAQSETVHVELETCRKASELPEDAEPIAPSSHQSAAALLIRRENAFARLPLPVTDNADSVDSDVDLELPVCLPETPRPLQRTTDFFPTPHEDIRQQVLTRASPTCPVAAESARRRAFASSPQRSLMRQGSPEGEHVQLGECHDLGSPGGRAASSASSSRPCDEDPEEEWYATSPQSKPIGGPNSWLQIASHQPPEIVPKTLNARNFEFHPTLPDIILMGDRTGRANVLDMEVDEPMHPPLLVGRHPLAAMVWMRQHPQNAICGVASTGEIVSLKYDPMAKPTEPALRSLLSMEEFPQLTCLSACCTDDFLLAGGASTDVSAYDVQTGRLLAKGHGLHEDRVTDLSFCHTSPHIFATVAAETCKVWDLRRPLALTQAVQLLSTGRRSKSLVFSPDDRHLLCGGVDTQLTQFEIPSFRQTPERFPLRESVYQDRHRCNCYFADSQHFATAGTEETHLHVMSVEGRSLGAVDFSGLFRRWPWSCGPGHSSPVFVQSMRAHPTIGNRIGVLLSPHFSKRSCMVLVDFQAKQLQSAPAMSVF